MMSASKLPLTDVRVVTFESRMASNMCQLIEKQGGIALSAPSMQEIPWEKNPDALQFGEKLFRGEIDILICLTGVGTRYLIQALETKFEKSKILAALNRCFVVARGPKPVKALKELAVKINISVPEPNTWRDVLVAMDESERAIDFENQTVAVQEYGRPNLQLVEELQKRKAKVIRVPVYRWALPNDTTPLKQAIQKIIASEIDVAVFTSAVQIDHLLRVASEMGCERELKSTFQEVVVASIGPICTEALNEYGIAVDLEPVHSKMGHLVLEIAAHAPELIEKKRGCQSTSSPHVVSGDPDSRFRENDSNDFGAASELQNSPFMKACRREKTSYVPAWLMRQAGRYMKEYRDVRAKVPFIELCKNKDLAAEVTVTAQEKIGADAAIIFSDILLIVEPLGLGLEYSKTDGPVIETLTVDQIAKIPDINPQESLYFVMDAIHETRKRLKPNIPLIGFSGAPFTLASYMIEGGSSKNFQKTKSFMRAHESEWRQLMEKIAKCVSKYLIAQINAGAQVVQLFDSWVGVLSPRDYETFVMPYSKMIFDSIQGKAPSIHFGTNTGAFLELLSKAGGDVIGVDFRIELDVAWKRIGYAKAVQGNMDPAILFSPVNKIREEVKRILAQANGRPGFVFNLGHGILPETPVEHVIELVRTVHELSLNESAC